LLWAYGLLIGLGIGSWLPAVSMNTSFNFGFADYGVIFGVFNMLFMTAGAIGPVIGGYIFDTTGSYYQGFQLSLIIFAVSIVSMLLVRRPLSNAVPDTERR
jgi:MFS family permease